MRIGQGAVPSVDVTDRITRDVGWVADRWLREIRAGRAFARAVQIVAGAGLFPHIQLINPAGSSITVIVYAAIVSSVESQNISLLTHNVAETLDGTGFNLLSGSAAAVGEIRTRNGTAVGTNLIGRARVLGSSPYNFVIGWHIQLGAGNGVVMQGAGAATTLDGVFQWVEV